MATSPYFPLTLFSSVETALYCLGQETRSVPCSLFLLKVYRRVWRRHQKAIHLLQSKDQFKTILIRNLAFIKICCQQVQEFCWQGICSGSQKCPSLCRFIYRFVVNMLFLLEFKFYFSNCQRVVSIDIEFFCPPCNQWRHLGRRARPPPIYALHQQRFCCSEWGYLISICWWC